MIQVYHKDFVNFVEKEIWKSKKHKKPLHKNVYNQFIFKNLEMPIYII